ncbi:MAG TPA: amino acid adenylation domain-containing protein, partial [Thermoanaerobaculia bacterium]|nr:amino acid adenylation domain-containing protein [Thermoanaerobaculia bacterium]
MADLSDRISRLSGDKRQLLEALLRQREEQARPRPAPAPAAVERGPLGEGERHAIVVEWNDTAADYPRETCLHELVAAQAARSPEAVAAIFGGVALSYGDLDRRAGLLARRLAEMGVGMGDRVGLLSARSNAMVVGLLGILKAGGAYVPLDPAYPGERLSYLLEDSRPAALLVEEDLGVLLPQPGVPVLALDAEGRAGDPPGGSNPEPLSWPVPAESLAYVIYTSGSTGRPKGVAVTHRGVCRLVLGSGFLPLGPGDRIAQTSSSSFDAATFEIWGALLTGAGMVGFAAEEVLSPPELARAVAEQGITVVSLTAAWFHRVAFEAPGSLASLRGLIAGGEAVDPRAFAAVLAAGTPERLIHAYGPTENTTFSSTHRVRQVPAGPAGPAGSAIIATLPIGRAIGNSRMLVLDADREPVPVGAEGELFVGGDGLAQGYLERPDLTAERFVPDPLGEPGGRLYATGDLARWLSQGEVEFLGRRDGQLKIRGFRIEPGEVEAALGAEPGVAEAAAVAQEEDGDRRLIAFVVPLPGTPREALPEVLRIALQKKLPSHLVPAAIGVIDALPLTPNGKL